MTSQIEANTQRHSRGRPWLRAALTVLATLLCTAAGAAQAEQATLKDAYRDHFRIGAAVGGQFLQGDTPEAIAMIEREFNQVTAENEMKWERIHPAEGEFNWDPADRLVELAERNDMQVAGHVLVWHQQTPQWVFETAPGVPATRIELLQRLKRHIEAVVGRYRGRVHTWEVVNEVLTNDGALRQTPWLEILGPDYIEQAFRFAHLADPEAKLYINDYSLYLPAKRDAMVRLVRGLLEKGVPVHAIGMQCHYAVDSPDAGAFEDSVEAFTALGLDLQVTEMDMSVLPYPGPETLGADLDVDLELQARFNPYPKGLPDAVAEAQAQQYENLFRVLLHHSAQVDRVTFWGLSDADSWKNNWPMRGRTDYPLLFDRAYQRKPAYDRVLRLATP